jgi:hypothetical protein
MKILIIDAANPRRQKIRPNNKRVALKMLKAANTPKTKDK